MVFLAVGSAFADARARDLAQDQVQDQNQVPPRETVQDQAGDRWIAPFGGTWSARFTGMSDYSFRGISLSEGRPAVQAAASYDVPIVKDSLHLNLEAWGGNVSFTPGVSTELTASASAVLYGFDRRFSLWLSFSRYNYLESAPELGYNYNDFSVYASWDFGVAQLAGSVNFSPNYYGNAGHAWYKQAELAVPLPLGRNNLQFVLFGSLGNLQVDRYLNAGMTGDTYWDWEIGVRALFHGFELTASYVDTNLDYAGCNNSSYCQARVILKLSKIF